MLSLSSISSNVNTWDIAESQTVPYILGIAHPTGFPAFVLLGWMFSHALAFGTVAWRLNVFSALWIAASAGGVALLAQTLGAGATEAALAAIAFALGNQAWFQGTHADVHAMVLACIVCSLTFAVRYLRSGARRDILLAAFTIGLGLATHPLAMFALPALALGFTRDRERLRRDGPLALAVLVAPLACYLYLPLRSAYVAAHGLDPTAAAPLFGRGTVAWDTEHPRTLAGFFAEVTGREYGTGGRLVNSFKPGALTDDLFKLLAHVPSELPYWIVALGFVGLVAIGLRDWRASLGVFAALFGISAFTLSVFFDPVDLERYLLPVYTLLIACAAAAAALPLPRVGLTVRRVVVVLLLATAVAVGWNKNPGRNEMRGGADGQRVIDLVRTSVPDGTVVVAAWVDATALAYGAFVEHALGTRVIALGWPSDFTAEYPRWTRQKRVVILTSSYGVRNMVRQNFSARSDGVWLSPLPCPDTRYTLWEVHPPRGGR